MTAVLGFESTLRSQRLKRSVIPSQCISACFKIYWILRAGDGLLRVVATHSVAPQRVFVSSLNI